MKKINTIKVLWAHTHSTTSEQISSLKENGIEFILYLKEAEPELIQELLNIQVNTDLEKLADKLISFCQRENYKVILQPAGNLAFQAMLAQRLPVGMEVWYAFTKRESVETTLPDGSVEKKSIFKFEGWQKVSGKATNKNNSSND